MLKLRPYKPSDAKTIVSWCKDEITFRRWTFDRYPSYPITADDMNKKYLLENGDCEEDNFYPFTAFDEEGITGHLIMRFTDVEKTILRLGFVILDSEKRGKGYGKEMISLAIKYAFEILRVEKLTIGVFENNTPALKCYKSAGFTLVDGEKNSYTFFDEEWQLAELEISKEKYFKSY